MRSKIRVSSRMDQASNCRFDVDAAYVPGFGGGMERGADAAGSTKALPGRWPKNPLHLAMNLPFPEEMEILYRFARKGSMRDISRRNAHLIRLDKRYRPFPEQLHSLVPTYQSKALLELVSRNADNPSHVS
ncbi:MAG: hypothetical protein ACXV7J_14805 [Methylomonas sp.]